MSDLPEWLRAPFASDVHLSTSVLVLRMVAALAYGCVVAAIYRWTHGREAGWRQRGQPAARGLMATLVLLTVLIAMMTLVIGDNVARAFSLVGALAIVRFRTVVEDTRDTAFVIFAVSVGMAVGAGFMKVPLVAIPVAAAAAFLFAPRRGALDDRERCFVVSVRLPPGPEGMAAVTATLAAGAELARLVSLGTARQGAAVEAVHEIRLRPGIAPERLLAELHALEGVQAVEMKRE